MCSIIHVRCVTVDVLCTLGLTLGVRDYLSLSLSSSPSVFTNPLFCFCRHTWLYSKDLISLWWASSSSADPRYGNISKDPVLYLYTREPVKKDTSLSSFIAVCVQLCYIVFPFVLSWAGLDHVIVFFCLYWNLSVFDEQSVDDISYNFISF